MENNQKCINHGLERQNKRDENKPFEVDSILFAIFLITLFCFPISLKSQPSGGPYGQTQQKYSIPKVNGKIYYVAVDGKQENSGETIKEPTTITFAIEKVKTGDGIIMRGGVYRTGNLFLNQGIIIQPYMDEKVVFKGTFIADKWENLKNGLWKTKWMNLFPSKPDDWWQRDHEGKKTPLYKFNNDMVFVDGKMFQAVGWEGEVNETAFYIDYESGYIYIGINPSEHLVEITAFNSAIIRTVKDCHGKKSDHKGYTISGITFTQYAYRALEVEGTEPDAVSDESQHGKEVVGTTLDNCEISFCSRVAGYFRGDKLTISNCKISETSTEGIYIIASNDVLLEKNIFTKNNNENITGYYPAAVKIFNQCYRVTCRDNLVIDLPNSNGIWYDVGNVDGVFVNNRIENVGCIKKDILTNQLWPSDNGFFFEISKGAVCAGNVFVDCDHGLMILNSSNVKVYNNTFVNSMACIGRDGRKAEGDLFGWHSTTGPDVDKRDGHIFVNNLMAGDENYGRPMLFVWQHNSLCGKLNKPQLTQMDYNYYVRKIEKSKYPLILFGPSNEENCQTAFESIDEMKKQYSEFSEKSCFFSAYNGPMFRCSQLGNFELLNKFAVSSSGSSIPADILKYLTNTKNRSIYIGAYPPSN